MQGEMAALYFGFGLCLRQTNQVESERLAWSLKLFGLCGHRTSHMENKAMSIQSNGTCRLKSNALAHAIGCMGALYGEEGPAAGS